MSDEEYQVPDGYYYTKDHEWVKREVSGTALVGITDYAAKMLHDIVYVTLPAEGSRLELKQVLGQVESVKTVADVYMPISGTVLKSNQKLTSEPELVSASPYEKGWMVEVQASSFDAEVKDLLGPEEYSKFIQDLKATG